MLLIVGEALAAFQRELSVDDEPGRASTPYRSPVASGAPLISAYIAGLLGVPVSFVGGVGRDPLGSLLMRCLDASGVTSRLVIHPSLPTASVHIDYLPDGSRRFDFEVTGRAAVAVAETALAAAPEAARWIHVSGSALQFGEPLASTVLAAARRAVSAGATLSVDPNIRAEARDAAGLAAITELLTMAAVVFPSEDELAAAGTDEQALVDRGVLVCRTLGADGALVRGAGFTYRLPALADPAAVVDTDGAGDTFAAAFIAATLDGAGPDQAARVASRVVAKAITVLGPTSVQLSPADLAGS
ncbi:MAG: fructokinase [Pseudonocardiales bacterium]|nr:fructokinase [Pseudonocardiales bacterium]